MMIANSIRVAMGDLVEIFLPPVAILGVANVAVALVYGASVLFG